MDTSVSYVNILSEDPGIKPFSSLQLILEAHRITGDICNICFESPSFKVGIYDKIYDVYTVDGTIIINFENDTEFQIELADIVSICSYGNGHVIDLKSGCVYILTQEE